MDHLRIFCWKVKPKEYFYGVSTTNNRIQQEGRRNINKNFPNCNFNPNYETPSILQRYTSIVKKEVSELLKKPNYQQSNLKAEERMKLNLSEDQNLTLKGSDKGGKLIDTTDYIQHCVLLFNNKELYEKLDANPKLSYAEKSKQKIDDILKHKYITD